MAVLVFCYRVAISISCTQCFSRISRPEWVACSDIYILLGVPMTLHQRQAHYHQGWLLFSKNWKLLCLESLWYVRSSVLTHHVFACFLSTQWSSKIGKIVHDVRHENVALCAPCLGADCKPVCVWDPNHWQAAWSILFASCSRSVSPLVLSAEILHLISNQSPKSPWWGVQTLWCSPRWVWSCSGGCRER